MIVWTTAYWIVVGVIVRELQDQGHGLAMFVAAMALWIFGMVLAS